MIYKIEKEKHNKEDIKKILEEHPEIKFVSLVGLDIYGNDTDEKIPVYQLLKDYDGFIKRGAQTDGSAVLLPKIADISNGRVDIIPDEDCIWYIDYNFDNLCPDSNLPVGTIRIPAYLIHNEVEEIGSRKILRDAISRFKREFVKVIKDNPYVLEYLPIDSADEIEEVILTAATEMEFYVMTPHEVADKERLHASQQMKEQYWKRTIGPVRTALEKTLERLEHAGLEVEMGHKEVGGVNPELNSEGFTHIMEQLEIDWKYDNPMQAADNDYEVRNLIKDTFRNNGLDVTFLAKPVAGVAGSGKHTHFGVVAKLKNGKKVNLFSSIDKENYMSPIGYGALMGILKNYDIISPFVSATNDSFNRLKPGYEAPICDVTSLGISVDHPSRNRTVLAGLIRDVNNPMATRFELRSPNPQSNTYLVLASGYLAILDGIKNVLEAKKSPKECEKSVSKAYGEKDFYLDTNKVYRVENDIFADYSPEEREKLFGKSPATVWENLKLFTEYPEKTKLLYEDDVMDERALESYKAACLKLWSAEQVERIIPKMREVCHNAVMLHYGEDGSTDVDELRWRKIDKLRRTLSQDSARRKSLLTKLELAFREGDFDKASDMQIEAAEKIAELESMYLEYKRNLF